MSRLRTIAALGRNAQNILLLRPLRRWQAAVQPHPRMELVARSGLFDRDWYLAAYPDVAATGVDPLRHFVEIGSGKGHSPGPDFDAAWYLEHYADIRMAGVEPLFHYLEIGFSEGRRRSARDKARFEANQGLRNFLDGRHYIGFRESGAPLVSVVVVTYNSPELVFVCLSTLAERLHVPAEVIVVDNASGDDTRRLLSRVEGARIILNESNVHFLRAVNEASQFARGEYILLLNSDAEVIEGSIEAAVQTLEASPEVGAVGGRIVLPDGTLQEAGSIVWNDGSCLGYGRGRNPESFEFMFRREVDFCSAAFLMVRRDIFRCLGGFDEAFAPAYYEDVDLCFRLCEAGYRIIYDPRVVINHFEYGSSRKSAHALALMQKNREVFCRKHAHILGAKYAFSDENVVFARANWKRERTVLYLDEAAPCFSYGSGMPRTRELLRAMVRLGFSVSFVPMRFQPGDWPDIYREVPVEVEVVAGTEPGRLGELVRAQDLEDFMASRAGLYGTVFVSRPHLMRTLVEVRRRRDDLFRDVEVIYDAEALFAGRHIAEAKTKGRCLSREAVQRLYSEEISLVRWADKVVSVSRQEASRFCCSGHPAVRVLAHAVDVKPTGRSFELRRDLLFVGRLQEDDSPNVDSVEWFAREVLPIVSERCAFRPRLFVIGRSGAARIRKLASPSVVLLGEVTDVRQWYDDCKIFVAPTRFAAGIPLKICEAAAAGIPVVATKLLAEQLEWRANVEILVASVAEEFADACVRLCTDDRLWRRIREGALEAARRDFDPAEFSKTLASVLARGRESD